jgi:hypothetical protein
LSTVHAEKECQGSIVTALRQPYDGSCPAF